MTTVEDMQRLESLNVRYTPPKYVKKDNKTYKVIEEIVTSSGVFYMLDVGGDEQRVNRNQCKIVANG